MERLAFIQKKQQAATIPLARQYSTMQYKTSTLQDIDLLQICESL